MKDLCPRDGEPHDEAYENWLWGDGPTPQTPPWDTGLPELPAGRRVKYWGDEDDDDSAAVSGYERHEDDDPDPGVLGGPRRFRPRRETGCGSPATSPSSG